jgi:hypothetical protein
MILLCSGPGRNPMSKALTFLRSVLYIAKYETSAREADPAGLTEATDPYWRPIKYSLFPPLGLATLAAFLDPADEAVLVDEHVMPLDIDDQPDLVLSRSTSPTPFARTGLPTFTGGAEPSWRSAACT